EERPSCLGISEREKRQHEDLGVPEDVAFVGRSGERARPDRDMLVVGIGGADEVVQGAANFALRGAVSGDDHIARLPLFLPVPAMLLHLVAQASLVGAAHLCAHRAAAGKTRALYASEAIEAIGLAELDLERPTLDPIGGRILALGGGKRPSAFGIFDAT